MEFTRIGSNNWGSFSPIVFDAYTQNTPEVLRIGGIVDGEVCGAMSISYDMAGDHAFVDSLYVVPKYRRQGLGREFLAEAERLVKPRVSMLEAEFFGGSDELHGVFENSGFACIPGEPIYDYDVKKLLSNKQYAKYCQSKLSGIATYTFVNMTQSQKNHVFNLLREQGERNTEANTAGFSPELSVAVYRQGDMRMPRACLIASVYEDQVTIAQLYGSGKNNPKFILATIFGFTDAIKSKGGSSSYRDLSMVAAHPGVKKVFELLFGKRLKPTESGLMHAIKLIV